MTDQKGKSLKFKIIFIVSALLVLVSMMITIFLLNSADISEEKLGPSPYIVDESLFSDDNEEYKKIIEIGKEIKGEQDFHNKDEGYKKNFQSAILRLQEYLKKNEGVIEKVDIELFKKCKLNKLNLNKQIQYEDLSTIKSLLNLIQNRITYNILTNNYEGAKTDLILSNNIVDELFKKGATLIDVMVFTAIKLMEIDNIKTLINQNGITEDQKFEILNIKQELITSQSLKIPFHFEIKYIQDSIKIMNDPKLKKPELMIDDTYSPFYTPFCYQPNRTAKLMREMTLKIIALIDNPTFASFNLLNDHLRTQHNLMERIEGNYKGKLIVDDSESVCKIMAFKIFATNNFCKQLTLAQKLLAYKRKTGALPASLADLNIDPQLYTDIYTGDPFLYSAQNGILQSLGRKRKNENLDITTKLLSPKEIHDILNKLDYNLTLYLK